MKKAVDRATTVEQVPLEEFLKLPVAQKTIDALRAEIKKVVKRHLTKKDGLTDIYLREDTIPAKYLTAVRELSAKLVRRILKANGFEKPVTVHFRHTGDATEPHAAAETDPAAAVLPGDAAIAEGQEAGGRTEDFVAPVGDDEMAAAMLEVTAGLPEPESTPVAQAIPEPTQRPPAPKPAAKKPAPEKDARGSAEAAIAKLKGRK
jgi:hypothetical protein